MEVLKMKKSNKALLIAILMGTVLLLGGCSAVFDAGLSGTLTDSDSSNGISGVMVYAYTDENLRNADFNRGATTNETGVKLSFSPSTSGNYIPATSTNADGEFSISKLIWKTTNPEFGKTASYLDVYLLYFSDDYGLVKEADKVTIVSDSSNSSRVKTSLTSRFKTKDIALRIKDAADDELSTTEFTCDVKVYLNTLTDHPYQDYSVNITGSETITVPYLADKTKGETTVLISLDIPDDSTWEWVDSSTSAYYKVVSSFSALNVTDTELRGDASITKTAYVKDYEFTYPSFRGTLNTESTAEKNDNIDVWLANSTITSGTTGRTLHVVDHVYSERDGNGANSSLVTHGVFTGLGDGVSWKPVLLASGDHIGDYEGAVAAAEVYIIVDRSDSGTVSKPDVNDWFYKIKVKCTDGDTRNLGEISEAKKKAFEKSSGDADYDIVAVIDEE